MGAVYSAKGRPRRQDGSFSRGWNWPHWLRFCARGCLLESLALGIPVVAAENGRRPRGVVTYRFADPADLCDKLCYVMDNYDAVKQATRLEEADNYVEQAADWLLREEQHTAAN